MTGGPGEADDPPGPIATGSSGWSKWVAVVIVGEVCLVVATLLLSSVLKVGNVLAYIGAFAIAILIAGRLGGVRGVRQWVLAAILVVLVAIVLVYAFILAVVSQIQGP